ncbi:cilia- and flagella-associated protein 184 isoform X2 [Dendrobates tinctorius]|uniref:cilia- and flagella-associated protein 184 isoform X2 n=1 Tax=Dendrobates tinctorius TaxID=92724 RepID=UPI003CC9C3AD
MEDVTGGDRTPVVVREPIVQPGTSQEPAGEPGTSQADTREPSTSQEGASEPGIGQECARDPGTSQESAREPGTSQQGAREPSTSQEGAREPGTSQEGARDPKTNHEGIKETSTTVEGTRAPNTCLEGANESSRGLEGTRDFGTSQEGTSVPEASVKSESVRDASTEHIKSIEAVEEDGPSEQQGEIPEGTNDDLSQFLDVAETGQEPKEDTHRHLEEQEDQEDAEQNQDHELREMVHEEQIREELIQQYHALVQERDKILQHNAQLQHKLYEYFRKKRGEETRLETTSKRASDQEQRYLKYLTSLEEMRRRYKEEAVLHQEQMEELRAQCQDIVSKVDKEWQAFQEQKKISLCSLSKQGAGKHAASSLIQEVDLLQSREERKEKEVIQVRLENIKLKNHIYRYESTLRSKEELAEGLHLIDFEQLKIENQTYNEKIEERNEELLKLRKKITNTVQVLTHVKEKLQFVQAENQEQKEKLMEVEALVGNKRDILTKTKQARDNLRMENLKLKQKCGLLGNKVLLRDFEDKVDAAEELRQTLENLKRQHAELTLSSKGLEKKISEVKLVIDV